MAKLIRIVKFNDTTVELQKKFISEMVILLPKSHIEAIGSTAVPLDGREEIDIMVISNDVEGDSSVLAKSGYEFRGMENEIAYHKKVQDGYEITPQILPKDHKMISIHRMIISKLRNDKKLRNAYASYKKSLEGLTKLEYRAKKSAWIKENLLI